MGGSFISQTQTVSCSPNPPASRQEHLLVVTSHTSSKPRSYILFQEEVNVMKSNR
jgi:hypothetical protein